MGKTGPLRGFGARYGATIRKRYRDAISEVKRAHKCPQCGFDAVKRKSVGVWRCRKCGFTFAGGAYTPVTEVGIVAKRSASGKASAEATEIKG